MQRDHQLKGAGDAVEQGDEGEGPEACLESSVGHNNRCINTKEVSRRRFYGTGVMVASVIRRNRRTSRSFFPIGNIQVGVAGCEGDKTAITFNTKSIEVVWWPLWDEEFKFRIILLY
ncbi:hypothetical protein Tco_1404257 [Tanacetum coccineum]